LPSFTAQVPNLHVIGPVVEVQVAVGRVLEGVLTSNGEPIPTPITASAMIDTGATGTVIRQEMPGQLGLNPVGTAMINTPSSEGVECYEYLVRLFFQNNVVIETLAIGAPLQGQHIQCLIGRDVLAHGVLIYVGYTNTFTLSF